jgi:hypothetical protein
MVVLQAGVMAEQVALAAVAAVLVDTVAVEITI